MIFTLLLKGIIKYQNFLGLYSDNSGVNKHIGIKLKYNIMTKCYLYILFLFSFFISSFKTTHYTDRHSVNSVNYSKLNVIQNTPADNSGKGIYIKYCMTCHQSDGGGVPQMYPPVNKSNFVIGDKNKLIKILFNGVSGEIEVNGEVYDQTMPKFDYLTNEQIANVLTYIRSNYNNSNQKITSNDVLMMRTTQKK
jgi:cytochrome c